MGGMSSRPRTSTDFLRRQDDEWLTRLLLLRPDAALPAPQDMSVLAGRLAVRVSVSRALDDLDAWTLQVLDGLILGPAPGSVESVTALCADADADEVGRAIERLRQRGLVWGDDEVNVVGSVRDAAVRYPGGLGRPAADLLEGYNLDEIAVLLDTLGVPRVSRREAPEAVVAALRRPARLTELLLAAPPTGRDILDRLNQDMPVGEVSDIDQITAATAASSPVGWLIAHGLVVLISSGYIEVPREVGLLLRGDFPLGAAKQPPDVPTTTVRRAELDERAGAHALEALRLLGAVLDEIAAEAPRVLKSGGLGSREAKRIAKAADVDVVLLALLLHTAHEADLLGRTTTHSPQWLPTSRFDEWREQPPEQQWPVVARAWLRMSSLPSLAGAWLGGSNPANVLAPELDRSGAGAARRRVLSALGSVGDRAAISVDDLVRVLRWRAPRRFGGDAERTARTATDESQTIGLTSLGEHNRLALSTAAQLLLDGADDAEIAAALGKALPDPVDHILLQADLTAIAPGRLELDLGRRMSIVADVESAGAATVYRITAETLRRALDVGISAVELHELFAARSRTPVPQTLTYLIDDAARRHGRLRVGAASAYLRCDDDSVASSILADPRLGHLGLRRLAPGVLVGTADPQDLLDKLAGAGYPPALETATGELTTPTARRPRVSAHRFAAPAARPPALDADSALQVVRKVRAGDEVSAARASVTTRVTTDVPGVTTAAALQLLQDAVRAGTRLSLEYVDASGAASRRLVTPTAINGGFLHAFDHGRLALRTFALHRIVSAGVVEP